MSQEMCRYPILQYNIVLVARDVRPEFGLGIDGGRALGRPD